MFLRLKSAFANFKICLLQNYFFMILNRFNILMLKIFFLKYNFNIFSNKKLFEKQLISQYQILHIARERVANAESGVKEQLLSCLIKGYWEI